MAADLPGAVLFACNLNTVRSPMAEALMKLIFGFEVYVDSCGVYPHPDLDPFVVAVIDELGGDLSHHHPKSFEDMAARDGSFDVVISLTPEAHHRALEFARGRAVDVHYWPTADPTLVTGSREQRVEAYRNVRNDLHDRILARFGEPMSIGG
jgi:protein-tyrosine-phosphatase